MKVFTQFVLQINLEKMRKNKKIVSIIKYLELPSTKIIYVSFKKNCISNVDIFQLGTMLAEKQWDISNFSLAYERIWIENIHFPREIFAIEILSIFRFAATTSEMRSLWREPARWLEENQAAQKRERDAIKRANNSFLGKNFTPETEKWRIRPASMDDKMYSAIIVAKMWWKDKRVTASNCIFTSEELW